MLISRVPTLLLAVCLPVAVAAAQSQPDSEPLPRTPRVWFSLGLGGGDITEAVGAISARASGNVSVGHLVGIVRATGSAEGTDGHSDHGEISVLGGLRLGGKHLYFIPAIGLGKARWTNDYCKAHAITPCTPEEAAALVSDGPVVAYDFGFHATKLFAGLAMNIMGVAGPENRSLTAVVFSIQLGAFGR